LERGEALTKIQSEILIGRDYLEEVAVCGMIILKWPIKK
jgi:hypothetical protein